jgi:hypothetical protein
VPWTLNTVFWSRLSDFPDAYLNRILGSGSPIMFFLQVAPNSIRSGIQSANLNLQFGLSTK